MLSTKALDWLMLYSVLNSKQKQLHGQESNKMRESILSWIGNFEEKMDLSHIHLAVHSIFKLSLPVFCRILQAVLD